MTTDRVVTDSRFLPPYSTNAFREGFRDLVPLCLGITVWGIVTGVAMVRGGVPLGWAITVGLVAYAGSAQLGVLSLLVARAPIPIVFVTATLVNLRFMIFSAAMRKYFAHLPFRKRYLSAYVNGDFSFTLFQTRFGTRPIASRDHEERMGYFWGVAILNFVVWNGASTLGMVIGSALPDSWGLELAATLALVSVMVPMLAIEPLAGRRRRLVEVLRAFVFRPVVAGVAVTAVASVVTVGWPNRIGLVCSMLLGITVALAFDHVSGRGGEEP